MNASYVSRAVMPVGRVIYAITLLCLLVVCPVLKAQINLVPNPSFESYTTIPTRYSNPNSTKGISCITRLNVAPFTTYFTDPVFVNNWFRGNQATSDYFHRGATCDSINGVRIPTNWGQEEPLNPPSGTGDAYAGFGMIRKRDIYAGTPTGILDYHEYIAVKLSNHLKANTEYLVQFMYAVPDYATDLDKKGDGNHAQYYLKKLGVAFAPDTSFLGYDLDPDWYSQGGVGLNLNAFLPIILSPTNYREVEELPYANPTTWQTFETRFICGDSALEYIIIGNFDKRISLSDIGRVPGNSIVPTNSESYEFYFFIDDVVVQEVETGSCNCTSIFTCPHTRDTTLELSHENTCCFTTPIELRPGSCKFSAIRVKASGVTVSYTPITNYGHIVTDTETVYVSFCTPFNSDSTQTYITYEFLDADSNVLCTKSGVVQCNCMCSTAGANIAEGVPVIVVENSFTKVDYDSTKCCWEFSLKNNYSCTFKDDFYLEVIDYGTGATYTALTGWKDTLISGSHHFSSTSGGLKFNTTSKVFRVCVSPQFGTTPPPISVSFKEQNHDLPCRNFQSIPLQCVGEENCCDKLNIELKAYSHSFHDCAFDLFMSNKGTMNKCKVFGVRIISGEGDTLYTLSPQSTALDLDVKKQIWYLNKGECIPSPYTGLPQYRKEGYTIEILDSTGAVKCSVSDTIRCCSTEAIPKAAIQDPTPIPLSVGGMITEAKIEGNSLHYSIKNMGDDLSATIQLTDLKGNNIKKRTLNLTKGNSAGEFDISHLPNGTYFISVQTDLWQTSRQIVIQK